MNFEGWIKTQDPAVIRDAFSAAAGWNAGQAAEREKYYQLIEKAEGVIAAWDNRFGPALLDTYVAALRDAVERIKHA